FRRDHLDYVREVVCAWARTIGHLDVSKAPRLVQRVLDQRARAAGPVGDPIDGQGACAVLFHFASDDGEDSALAFGVAVPDLVRQGTRTAEETPAFARGLRCDGARSTLARCELGQQS